LTTLPGAATLRFTTLGSWLQRSGILRRVVGYFERFIVSRTSSRNGHGTATRLQRLTRPLQYKCRRQRQRPELPCVSPATNRTANATARRESIRQPIRNNPSITLFVVPPSACRFPKGNQILNSKVGSSTTSRFWLQWSGACGSGLKSNRDSTKQESACSHSKGRTLLERQPQQRGPASLYGIRE
jgi:hypothetical protein